MPRQESYLPQNAPLPAAKFADSDQGRWVREARRRNTTMSLAGGSRLEQLMLQYPDASQGIPHEADLTKATFSQLYNEATQIYQQYGPLMREYLSDTANKQDPKFKISQPIYADMDALIGAFNERQDLGDVLKADALRLYTEHERGSDYLEAIQRHDPLLVSRIKEQYKWWFDWHDSLKTKDQKEKYERLLKGVPMGLRKAYVEQWLSLMKPLHRATTRQSVDNFNLVDSRSEAIMQQARESEAYTPGQLEAMQRVLDRERVANLVLSAELRFRQSQTELSHNEFERHLASISRYKGTLLDRDLAKVIDTMPAARRTREALDTVYRNPAIKVESLRPGDFMTREQLVEFWNTRVFDFETMDMAEGKSRLCDALNEVVDVIMQPHPPSTFDGCIKALPARYRGLFESNEYLRDKVRSLVTMLTVAPNERFVPDPADPDAGKDRDALRKDILGAHFETLRGSRLGFLARYKPAEGEVGNVPNSFSFHDIPDNGRRKRITIVRARKADIVIENDADIYGSYFDVHVKSNRRQFLEMTESEQKAFVDTKGADFRSPFDYAKLIKYGEDARGLLFGALNAKEKMIEALSRAFNDIKVTVDNKAKMMWLGPMVRESAKRFYANVRAAGTTELFDRVELQRALGVLVFDHLSLRNHKVRAKVQTQSGVEMDGTLKREANWSPVEYARHLYEALGWKPTENEWENLEYIGITNARLAGDRPLLRIMLHGCRELRQYDVSEVVRNYEIYANIDPVSQTVSQAPVPKNYTIQNFEGIIEPFLNNVSSAERPPSPGDYLSALPYVQIPADFEAIAYEMSMKLTCMSDYCFFNDLMTKPVDKANRRVFWEWQSWANRYLGWPDKLAKAVKLDKTGFYKGFRYAMGGGYWGGSFRDYDKFMDMVNYVYAMRRPGLKLEPTADNRYFVQRMFGEEGMTSYFEGDRRVISVDDILEGNYRMVDIDAGVASFYGSGTTRHQIARYWPVIGAYHEVLQTIDSLRKYTYEHVASRAKLDLIKKYNQDRGLLDDEGNEKMTQAVMQYNATHGTRYTSLGEYWWYVEMNPDERRAQVNRYLSDNNRSRRIDTVKDFAVTLDKLSGEGESPTLSSDARNIAEIVFGCPITNFTVGRNSKIVPGGVAGNYEAREEKMAIPDTDDTRNKEMAENIRGQQSAMGEGLDWLMSFLPAGQRVAGSTGKRLLAGADLDTAVRATHHGLFTFWWVSGVLSKLAHPHFFWISLGVSAADFLSKVTDRTDTAQRENERRYHRVVALGRGDEAIDGGGLVKFESEQKNPDSLLMQINRRFGVKTQIISSSAGAGKGQQ